MAQTVDERMERIKVLDREIAAVPNQISQLKMHEEGMKKERGTLVSSIREEMGSVLRTRKRKDGSAPAAKPGRPAGAPTRPPYTNPGVGGATPA